VPTVQLQPRFAFPRYDAPCCGASAASHAFVVTQKWPCSAACRCCGTTFVEGTVIPGANLDSDQVRRRVREIAPWLSDEDAFVEPWACRSRFEIRVVGDEEFTSVSEFFSEDLPARGVTPEEAAQ